MGAIPPFLQLCHCYNLDMQKNTMLKHFQVEVFLILTNVMVFESRFLFHRQYIIVCWCHFGNKEVKRMKTRRGLTHWCLRSIFFFFQMNDLLSSSLDKGNSHYLVMIKGSDIKGLPHPGAKCIKLFGSKPNIFHAGRLHTTKVHPLEPKIYRSFIFELELAVPNYMSLKLRYVMYYK